MTRLSIALFTATLMTLGSAVHAQASPWVAGTHYTILPQAQRTNVAPGKVEVMEVFSYGCPACNHFRPVMAKLKASLPANAQMVYLPASWNAPENWPVFQRNRWAWQTRRTTRCSMPSGPQANWAFSIPATRAS
jgi:thiol:disulfide interchange protein DsbA